MITLSNLRNVIDNAEMRMVSIKVDRSSKIKGHIMLYSQGEKLRQYFLSQQIQNGMFQTNEQCILLIMNAEKDKDGSVILKKACCRINKFEKDEEDDEDKVLESLNMLWRGLNRDPYQVTQGMFYLDEKEGFVNGANCLCIFVAYGTKWAKSLGTKEKRILSEILKIDIPKDYKEGEWLGCAGINGYGRRVCGRCSRKVFSFTVDINSSPEVDGLNYAKEFEDVLDNNEEFFKKFDSQRLQPGKK